MVHSTQRLAYPADSGRPDVLVPGWRSLMSGLHSGPHVSGYTVHYARFWPHYYTTETFGRLPFDDDL